MGYTTDFEGMFTLDKPLAHEHHDYLRKFADTRRMQRDAKLTETMPDPVRLAVGLGVGDEGGYFVGINSWRGQAHTTDVLDYNRAPEGQPGLWCQWSPNDDGTALVWDDGEKFYAYTEWLMYIIDHFLKPWGYTLNGSVTWQGESTGDSGVIYVKNNEVRAVADETIRKEPEWT